MPIFMDLHVVPGVTAKHVAEAHQEDLKIQSDFGCRVMTYWVDEDKGSAFCLMDAPNKEAVIEMHESSHGLIPHEIIQVNSKVVEAFLGRVTDPEGYLDPDKPDLKIFNDPAFRIILVAGSKDSGLLYSELGKEKAKRLIGLRNQVIRQQIDKYEGSEVELKGEGFVISFASVSFALQCAMAIQEALHIAGDLMDLRMGLHAGMPVSQSNQLFGATIKFAQYLSSIGKENQIVMSAIVKELTKPDEQKIMASAKRIKWMGPKDESFLELLMDTLSTNWENPQFGVLDFCHQLSMSKSQLYRKCTAMTGMSPNELLRDFRLQQSLDLLKTDRNIAQTTFDAGFSSPSYFTKCFQKKFGLQPIAYLKNQA